MKAVFLSAVIISIISLSVAAVDANELWDLRRGPGHNGQWSPQKPVPSKLTPQDIYQRTEYALSRLGVAPDASAQNVLVGIRPVYSQEAVKTWLPILDPYRQFERFFVLNGNRLQVFKDRDAKSVVDFTVKLRSSYAGVMRSLAGLRIAIDPGHMGGEFWDHETGKYAHDSRGRTISEGLINLQTALLLKQELEALGAKVLLTRTTLAPVTSTNPKDLNLREFAKYELRRSAYESWFQELVQKPNLTDIDTALRRSEHIQFITSERMRMNYFILREDLFARARMINEFRPNLTLVIHFDATDTPGRDPQKIAPWVTDRTRAYVPGAFLDGSLSSSESRAYFLAQLLQTTRLSESVEVSDAIVSSIATKLGVPRESSDGSNTVPIKPGVFARDLELTRLVTVGAISYLECFMYGSDAEFKKLLAKDYTMEIDRKPYSYSQRLKDLVSAIRDGIVSHYQGNE